MTSDDLNQIDELLKKRFAESEQRLKEEMEASDKKVMADIGSFMEDSLFPLIEEKAEKSDIERLERKLDKVLDTSIDHESRIKDIEQIPAVAHDLKIKKRK